MVFDLQIKNFSYKRIFAVLKSCFLLLLFSFTFLYGLFVQIVPFSIIFSDRNARMSTSANRPRRRLDAFFFVLLEAAATPTFQAKSVGEAAKKANFVRLGFCLSFRR